MTRLTKPRDPLRLPRRLLSGGSVRQKKAVAWGFIDQALSSATNFGLSVLAGRLLGPQGLGTVFLAFSVYLIALMLQRSLVTETLLAVTSALDPEERAKTAGHGLTMSLLGAVLATGLVMALAMVTTGAIGTALFLIAPWLVGALVQDFWRSLLFREGRASVAAANDAVWLVVMALAVPICWKIGTDSAVMAAWGLGACGGAVVGFWQTRVLPSRVRDSWAWWSKKAWPFGRWNAATSIVGAVGSNIEAFVLVGIIGASALGGFRAVQSLFAPLSLIAPAVGLPGLPAIARAYADDFHRARSLALGISGIAVAASIGFFAFLFLGGWRLLTALFGADFEQYRDLMFPVAIGQMFAAASVGFELLIKVQQRGRFLLFSRLFVVVFGLVLVATGAAAFGLTGAAWATAVWLLLRAITLGLGVLRDPGSRRSSAPRSGGGLDPTSRRS
jgi:O-antigen/teichoic acid export membrane protein